MNYYELEKALYDVTSYGDITEYIRSTTYSDDYTEDDFYDDLKDGYIQEITCGTYNGATDTFTPRTLTNESLFDTILNAIHESDFKEIYAEDEDIERVKSYTNSDWVEDFTLFYDVFTIGNHVYYTND